MLGDERSERNERSDQIPEFVHFVHFVRSPAFPFSGLVVFRWSNSFFCVLFCCDKVGFLLFGVRIGSGTQGDKLGPDAFTAALAKEKNAELLRGDQEFKALGKEIKIHWLKEG